MDLMPVVSAVTAVRIALAALALLARILLLAAPSSSSRTDASTDAPSRPRTSTERIIAGVAAAAQIAGTALAVLQLLHDAGFVHLW